jgi:glycosyltransferase involved in cell wall biosynthesis
MTRGAAVVDVVIPTVGRPSLTLLLARLAEADDGSLGQVIVVDDSGGGLLEIATAPACTTVVRTRGRQGPAAARNLGWHHTGAEFVAFLDDDVMPGEAWVSELADDLRDLDPDVAAVQGRITVPRSARPSDWERNTARLETASWITADLVVRRAALEAVGGFDERFRRAYREDTDLAVRLLRAGWRLHRGRRRTAHPVRPTPWWISVKMQAGNADDVLLDRLHGDWRAVVGEQHGRFRRHEAIVALLGAGLGATVAGQRRVAAFLGLASVAGCLAFAWERIRPGPQSFREVTAMGITSAAIPPVAVWHRCRGSLRHRNPQPWPPAATEEVD